MNENPSGRFQASMRELASIAGNEGSIPDASLIWWKAEIRQRLERQQRAALPIRAVEAAAAVVCVATAIWLLASAWLVISPVTQQLGLGIACYWLGVASATVLITGIWRLRLLHGRSRRSRDGATAT